MAEVVDSIVAQLEVRLGTYVRDFDTATAAHGRFEKSVDRLKQLGVAPPDRYAEGAARAATAGAAAHEQAAQRTIRAKRTQADAIKAADQAEVASAKSAANARAEAEEAAQARIAVAVERGLERQRNAVKPGTRGVIGSTVAREGSGQASIPAAVLAGGGEAAEQKEVNLLMVEQAELQSRLTTARGADRRIIQDQIGDLRLVNQLQRAGLADEEISLRLEERRALLGKRPADPAHGSGAGARNAEQFARGSGLYAATGGGPAIAGIATAAAVGGGIAAVSSSLGLAKELADNATAVGVSVRQLQVYQVAAAQAGVSNEQLRSSFSQLSNLLGRAKEGDEQASKAFKALGIDIRSASSAGDILPTLVERISSIPDPAKRAAVETRLFGEEGRRLDSVLGGGTAKVDALATSLQRAGTILSEHDIATLREADEQLGRLRLQLQVDLARIVAGNTGAILGLANAFAALAEKVLGAATRLREFSAAQIVAGQHGSEAYQGRARDELLNTHSGRQYLFDNVQGRLQIALREHPESVPGGDHYLTNRRDSQGRPLTLNQSLAAERQAATAPLLAERRQILERNRQDRQQEAPPPVQPGNVGDLSKLFAPKGPKGKSAEALAAEAEGRTRRYLDQLAGLQESELRGQEQLTGSINKRADIEVGLADRALEKQKDDIAATRRQKVDRGADAKLEAERARQLAAAAQLAHDTQVAGINQQRQAELIAASNQHLQTRLSIEAEQISAEAALATTRKERLALELRALDNQRQREHADLQTQLASLKPGDPARADVQARLDSLPQAYAARAKGVQQDNASPIAAYRRQLHSATDDMHDALEGVAVDGLNRVEDSAARTIGQVVKLKGAFGDLFSGILEDIARLELKKGILALLGGGDSGSGGFLSGLLGGSHTEQFSGALSESEGADALVGLIPGFATGGSGVIGGNPGRDQNVLSLNGRPALRVGAGETLTITPPNVAAANQRAVAPSMSTTIRQTVNVDASGSVNPDGYAEAIVGHVRRETKAIVAQSQAATLQSVPGVVKRQQTLVG